MSGCVIGIAIGLAIAFKITSDSNRKLNQQLTMLELRAERQVSAKIMEG